MQRLSSDNLLLIILRDVAGHLYLRNCRLSQQRRVALQAWLLTADISRQMSRNCYQKSSPVRRSPSSSLVVESPPRSMSLNYHVLYQGADLAPFALSATTFLVNQGRKVTMIFDKADNFIAAKTPLPDVIRKGRLLSVLSPHIHLRTKLE